MIMTRTAFVVCAALTAFAQSSLRTGAPPFSGRLYSVVSHWTPDERLTVSHATLVSPSLRGRFERFTKCYASFKSQLADSNDFFVSSALPQRRVLERALACLIEAPAALAADYATRARILYEWEGMSRSPLEEARFAETYITEHPDSPLLPYLHLFVAERARCAFELLAGENAQAGMAVTAALYRTFIDRARKADTMVGLVAKDLDGLSFVYRNIGQHPRNYPSASQTSDGLDSRIPAPIAAKYKDIRDARDWLNPKVIIRAEGVEVVSRGLATGRKTVPVAELRALIISLPVDDWPYGRVVFASDIGLRRGDRSDDEPIKQNHEAAERILKVLGITVDWWPG
jgi:hypothetical protein